MCLDFSSYLGKQTLAGSQGVSEGKGKGKGTAKSSSAGAPRHGKQCIQRAGLGEGTVPAVTSCRGAGGDSSGSTAAAAAESAGRKPGLNYLVST